MRHLLIILGSITTVAVLAGVISFGRSALQQIEFRRAHQRESLNRWYAEKKRLKSCAVSLNAEIGANDASISLRRGDRRLLGIYTEYQESTGFDVPGINPLREPEGVGDVRDHVDGRIGDDIRVWRIDVRETPKGESWFDPWGDYSRAMGRPPDSATPCNRATRAYVLGYNQAVLRAGAAKKLINRTDR